MNKSSYTEETANEVNTINTLYRSCNACSDELNRAYAEWERHRSEDATIRRLQERYDEASAKFDDFKKRMTSSVKFDTSRGEYFPATDEHGRERFRIKVTLAQTVTLDVLATSEADAISKAQSDTRIYHEVDHATPSYSYENVSI